MATPQQRRKARSGIKLTRRKTDRKKHVKINNDGIVKKYWDPKLTCRQNYKLLGLMGAVNGVAGGEEKSSSPSTESDDEAQPTELKELTEEEIKDIESKLPPGQGVILRDDDGNVTRVIVGKTKTHDEILDEEPEPVEAATEFVKELEKIASSGVPRKRHLPSGEIEWITKLITKHGDDYRAMFWDLKLNPYQLTEAKLKQKCLLLKESQ